MVGRFSPPMRRRGSVHRFVALVGLVYATAVRIPFIYDDNRMVVENSGIHDLSDIRAVLLEPTRPILNLSYAIDYALFGPFRGFHSMNVLLHALNVVLLFSWPGGWPRTRRRSPPRIRRCRADRGRAVCGAPDDDGAVTYVAGRSEVLCGAFFLLAFMAGRRWMLGGARIWWLSTLALDRGAGHQGSRGDVAVRPPAYERLVSARRHRERRAFVEWHVPLIAVASAVVGARVAVLRSSSTPVESSCWRLLSSSSTWCCATSHCCWCRAARRFFTRFPRRTRRPADLAGDCGTADRRRSGRSAPRAAASASFGLFWFLLLLVPSLALVVFDRGEPMAEHRIYLASMGCFWVGARARRAVGAACQDRRSSAAGPRAPLRSSCSGWPAAPGAQRGLERSGSACGPRPSSARPITGFRTCGSARCCTARAAAKKR